jgi:hypothetical protein
MRRDTSKSARDFVFRSKCMFGGRALPGPAESRGPRRRDFVGGGAPGQKARRRRRADAFYSAAAAWHFRSAAAARRRYRDYNTMFLSLMSKTKKWTYRIF